MTYVGCEQGMKEDLLNYTLITIMTVEHKKMLKLPCIFSYLRQSQTFSLIERERKINQLGVEAIVRCQKIWGFLSLRILNFPLI